MDDIFRMNLLAYFNELQARVMTEDSEWTVKGFIDIYQRIYTISLDTKVLSKVLELLILPIIQRFADENGYSIILAKAQNQYPDISLVSITDETLYYALDIKTTYRLPNNPLQVSGMTLGTFGGYFRTRDRPVSSTFAYNQYAKHYVLGVVYSRKEIVDERTVYTIDALQDIPSVAHDFQFFLQEKYLIASDIPGSGNTKNIGSTKHLERLVNGTGVFAKLGIEVFDDYWMHYRTKDMAKADGFDKPPYTDLKSYQTYKQQGMGILSIPQDEVETEADTMGDEL